MYILLTENGQLQKIFTEADLALLTQNDYDNLVTGITARLRLNGNDTMTGPLKLSSTSVTGANHALPYDQFRLHRDNSASGVHGSTDQATPNTLIHRDANGLARVGVIPLSPDSDIIANCGYVDVRVDSVDDELTTHEGTQTVGIHGSTVTPTPGMLMHRDANGRSQVADPIADDEVVNLRYLNSQLSDHAGNTPLISNGSGAGDPGSGDFPATPKQGDEFYWINTSVSASDPNRSQIWKRIWTATGGSSQKWVKIFPAVWQA